MRSYVPFTIVCAVCLALLLGLVTLVAHLLPSSGGHPVALPAPTATIAVPAMTPVRTSRAPSSVAGHRSSPLYLASGTRYTATALPAAPAPTVTMQVSAMSPALATFPPLLITPGRALPTRTPTATATPDGNAHLVIARNVDANEKPVQAANRFLSPAHRLYAIVTVHSIAATDVLRFVFERNQRLLPGDDISYTAGGDTSHTFTAYADYANGTQPLPRGRYQLLFYRNGRLEAETTFTVGE